MPQLNVLHQFKFWGAGLTLTWNGSNTTSAPSAEILHRPSGGVSVLFAAAAVTAQRRNARRRSHYIRHRRAARCWAVPWYRATLLHTVLYVRDVPNMPLIVFGRSRIFRRTGWTSTESNISFLRRMMNDEWRSSPNLPSGKSGPRDQAVLLFHNP